MIALINIGGEMQSAEMAWYLGWCIVGGLVLMTGFLVGLVIGKQWDDHKQRSRVFRSTDARAIHGDARFDPESVLFVDSPGSMTEDEAWCQYFGEHCYGPARDGIEQCEGCGHAREARRRS